MMPTAKQIIDKRRQLWEQHESIEQDKEYRHAVAKEIIKEHAASLRKEIKDNPKLLIEMFFIVVDKNQRTVPFFLNDVQREFLNDLKQDIADFAAGIRLFLKYLILKGRQQGFSQVITAYQLCLAITQKNFAGVTLADDIDNTNTMFEKKAKYPYTNLPEYIKPVEKFNSRKELLFSNLNSSWSADTAGKKEVGRSRTLNFFHGSEAAFWPSISSIITGLGEALTKGSIQILESTANGFNEYKDLWDNAGDGEPGYNTWQQKFYAWWRTSEYVQEYESYKAQNTFENKVKHGLGDDKEEIKVIKKISLLMNLHNLSWAQVYWYYNKWKGYIDKEKIKQEYPCSPEEAFLASGRCVFDKEVVVARIDCLRQLYLKQPPKRGEFLYQWNDAESQDYIKNDTIKFVERHDGPVTIYADPESKTPYAIGGDTKGEGKDYYASTVKNNVTNVRVATIHAMYNHSKPYTWQTYCLGRYYNIGIIGIEMNWNTAPIEELDRLHYPRQYVRKVYDKIGSKYEERYGWKTDGNTRPLIIDKEIALINEHPELFMDITMLQECLTFIYDKDGRPDAESGKHDDILLSDMVCNEVGLQQAKVIVEETAAQPQKLLDKLKKRKVQ